MKGMRCKITIFALVFVTVQIGECYRILMFMPFSSRSHKQPIIPLIQGLTDNNHHVTFITNSPTDELKTNNNVEEIVIQMNMTFSLDSKEKEDQTFFESVMEGQRAATLKFLNHFRDVPEQTALQTFQNEQVQRMLTNNLFDVVLISQVTGYVGYPFAWHFKCPFILISPNTLYFDIAYILGDSENTHYVPFIMGGFTDHMTLVERTMNTVLTHSISKLSKFFNFGTVQKIVQSYLPDCPALEDIERNVSLVFTNSHTSINYPRSLPPTVIEIGTIHCRPANPLPQNLQDFVEASGDDGFIVFSLGSIIPMKEMPVTLVNMFVRVFGSLKQRIVWQWKDPPNSFQFSSNIFLVNWLPQQDLLGHPKCRAFITHGGLLSTQEAVYHGVPMVGLPAIIDQEVNMKKSVRDGYAVSLEWNAINEKVFSEAILQVLYNNSYQNKVKEYQAILKDQPQTPLKRAIFWTEYVIRHKGTAHMSLASRNLSRYQRALLDVYFVLLCFVGLFLFFIVKCVSCTCRKGLRAMNKHEKSE